MINSLQILRVIFSVMIFLHHYTTSKGGLFEAGGTFGVSFFFILSGFVLMLGYKDKVLSADFSYYQFIKKRFLKIYPLHLLCLCAYIILSFKNLDSSTILKLIPNILLVQSWIPNRSYYFSGNALSWYLSNILFYYACFPFLARFIAKSNCYKKKILTITIISLYALAIIIIPSNYSHAFFYISPITRILDFILGILICEAYLRREQLFPLLGRVNIPFLIIILLIITPYYYTKYYYLQQSLFYSAYYWIPVGLIIMLAAFKKEENSTTRFNKTANKIIKRCSDSSFTFFMIHILGLKVFNLFLVKYNIDLPHTIRLLTSFIIITISAYYIENYINKPIVAYLNKNIR